jgi:hypothetical protein
MDSSDSPIAHNDVEVPMIVLHLLRRFGFRQWLTLTLASLIFFVAGCAANYGRIQPDKSVTSMFAEGNLPANHKYYFNGRENSPWAVIGIDPSYQLLSKFWTEVPAGSDVLAQRIKNVWSEPSGNMNHPPEGGRIVSDDGKQVGIWYSGYAFTNVKMEGDSGVYVYSPYDPGTIRSGF